MRAKWRLCEWCGRQALRGKPWCKCHGPGRAADRRPRRKEGYHWAGAVLQETWVEKTLTARLAGWPPVERIARQPKHGRAVSLASLARALFDLALGDPEPWAERIGALRDAGLLLDSDPPLRGNDGQGT
jgi:hypothetical protein